MRTMQDLKMAITMAAGKVRELKTIPHQIPAQAEYLKVHLYRRRYLVALMSLSTVLLVTAIFTFQNTLKGLQQVEDEIKTYEVMTPQTGESEEKTASRVLDISVSDNGSQSRLNLGSWTLPPDSRGRAYIVSKETKEKTPLLNGRTQRISKRKTKGGRVRSLLVSNIGGKDCLEQQLGRAYLLSTSHCGN